jgi:hypothetical protein
MEAGDRNRELGICWVLHSAFFREMHPFSLKEKGVGMSSFFQFQKWTSPPNPLSFKGEGGIGIINLDNTVPRS